MEYLDRMADIDHNSFQLYYVGIYIDHIPFLVWLAIAQMRDIQMHVQSKSNFREALN